MEPSNLNPEPDNQAPQTDQTNPAPTVTNDFEVLIKTTLAENERARIASEQRVRQLEDENAALKIAKEKETQQAQLPNDQEFYSNPVDTINKLIQTQIGPLNQFTQQVQQQNAYTLLKQQYRNQYPAFTQIESTVDEFMAGLAPTHQNMQIAIQRAVGHLVMTNPSLLQNQNQNPPAQNNSPSQLPPTPQNVPSQAHLRPSNTPPASQSQNDSQQKHRPLTENEKRICRESNLSEERFWELMEKPIQVESWKPEKKK